VLAATTDYEEDSDPLGDFLSTACEQREGASVGATALYKHYEAWADQQGLTARDRLSATLFGRKATERFDKRHTEVGKVYFGVEKRNILTGLDQ
jgi:phage/plasmid-associated DNA primase